MPANSGRFYKSGNGPTYHAMSIIELETRSGKSRILIGERLANLSRHLPVPRPVVITDVNVRRLYALDSMDADLITIGTGEEIKTLDTVREIYSRLLSYGADRSSFIVGIGGGIVCDIAGFAAATFLRGLRFGFVATTLLAQVDASIGGKNGVNFGGYKNMVGVFQQPEFVICEPHVLKTLPEEEVRCGLAEIAKHAAIADADLFAYLERQRQSVLALDEKIVAELVDKSVRIKAAVVCRDERENDGRRVLNFGHTFGHAIEKVSGLAHGEAVSLGMAMAAAVSVKKGLLSASEEKRLKALLDSFRLPTARDFESGAVIDAISKDKKREGSRIRFVLLEKIGRAVVEPITLDELQTFLNG